MGKGYDHLIRGHDGLSKVLTGSPEGILGAIRKVPEDSKGGWRRSGNSFGLGKPKVAHCRGWLKAEGLASAECHGLSALPQCRKVESMGLFVLQVQPPKPGSNLAKIGIASQPRDVK